VQFRILGYSLLPTADSSGARGGNISAVGSFATRKAASISSIVGLEGSCSFEESLSEFIYMTPSCAEPPWRKTRESCSADQSGLLDWSALHLQTQQKVPRRP
jgi:hypothetical protein